MQNCCASPKYFAASYIMEHELRAIRKLQKVNPDTLLIPVVLERCDTSLFRAPQPVPAAENKRLKPGRRL